MCDDLDAAEEDVGSGLETPEGDRVARLGGEVLMVDGGLVDLAGSGAPRAAGVDGAFLEDGEVRLPVAVNLFPIDFEESEAQLVVDFQDGGLAVDEGFGPPCRVGRGSGVALRTRRLREITGWQTGRAWKSPPRMTESIPAPII